MATRAMGTISHIHLFHFVHGRFLVLFALFGRSLHLLGSQPKIDELFLERYGIPHDAAEEFHGNVRRLSTDPGKTGPRGSRVSNRLRSFVAARNVGRRGQQLRQGEAERGFCSSVGHGES